MKKNVCIVGLGLLGTSLAMALDHQRYRVTAWCRDSKVAVRAKEQQIIESYYESPEQAFAQ